MSARFTVRTLVALAVLARAAAALAVDVGDGKLSIHGNGGWNYAITDRNFYQADSDGDYRLSMFDLALSARPADRLVISAQLGFGSEEGAGLEWAFAEWRFSDVARLRIGQVKHPFGNFMEAQFVGTARPFFTLPTSVYGPADLGAASYYGVGLTGDLDLGGDWALQYDAYGGAIDLDTFEPYQALEPGFDPDVPLEEETVNVENIVGGRVSLTAPNGLVFRASAYGGRVAQEEGEGSPGLFIGGLSALFRGDRLWLSAEAFVSREAGSERQVSAYAEAAWFVTERLQAAARYEVSRKDLDAFDGSSPLLRHDEAGFGLSFWFTPEFVVKASVHRAEGLRFVQAEEGEADPARVTWLGVAGAQFSF